MAETKKFLDFTGLQKYDELLKKKVADDIKKVQDDLNTRKVKDIANSDTITWSTAENGTYTGSVKGVVLDNADYTAVKTNATQSAAAWTKFLKDSESVYPNNITPALKDLATKKETSDALASAKSYADGLASNYDAAGAATQALADAKTYADGLVKDAQGNVKFDTKGSAAQALVDAKKYAADQDTANLATAKSYAEEKATAAKDAAIQAAKDYADGLASNYDAAGAAAQALADAKKYANDTFDTKGSAEAAKNAAISAAKTYTDTEIKKVDDQIKTINTSIAGGVHFRGVVDPLPVSPFTGYVNGDIVIVGNKEYILNKPTEGDGEWVELGDTTAESQRITNLEGHVNTLRGDENTTGSVAKALKDAKAFTTGEINTLVGASGQVGKNTAAIATLNANAQTEGSVDYKIAQAVSNIEASIDTISEADINTLFSK